ncbi:MAG: DUF3618 domain-containing protein [Myxococcota bacterium]|nr:DUF3618 domain-containing protein [Myxococcota bacterium]
MTESEKQYTGALANSDTSTERLREGIEQTRAGMSATINALEGKLRPEDLKEKIGVELQHVEDKVREVVREHLTEAKTIVKDGLSEAKNLLRVEMDEAESKIKKGLAEARDTLKSDLREELTSVESKLKTGLAEARDTVKTDLQEAVAGAKRSIRGATLGRVEKLATDIGDAMTDTRDTLIETIRQNPLPAALAGLGVAWLLMNRSKSAASRRSSSQGLDQSGGIRYASERGGPVDLSGGLQHTLRDAPAAGGHGVTDVGLALGNAVHRIADTASGLMHDASGVATGAMRNASAATGAAVHDASDFVGRVATQTASAASSLVHGAGDAATSVAGGARNQARRVEQGLQKTLQETPMALGAVALIAGAAVGFSLPRTHGEDALMGDARDQVMRRVGSATHDAAHAVGQLTEKTADAAKHFLDEESKASSSATRTR